MAHLVDDLRLDAAAGIEAMRAAALAARDAHARAELLRHMLMTATKVRGDPVDDAVRFIVDHWLEAWHLDRTSWPHVRDMEAFAAAFHAYANSATDAHDAAVRARYAALDAAFAATGMTIADRMAWRSICAHGWWAQVRPAPSGKGRPDRDWPAAPFWMDGCPAHCL